MSSHAAASQGLMMIKAGLDMRSDFCLVFLVLMYCFYFAGFDFFIAGLKQIV